MVHFPPGFADRDSVSANGKVIFVFFSDAPLFILVNERLYMIPAAVGIISHCIMGGIQKPFADMMIRQEAFHSETGFQESMGIMFGGWIQKREDRQVTFRVGSDYHIKVVAMIKAVSGRIPSDITVWLGKITVTSAVCNAITSAVTDTVPAFPCGSDKGCAINGKSAGFQLF